MTISRDAHAGPRDPCCRRRQRVLEEERRRVAQEADIGRMEREEAALLASLGDAQVPAPPPA